MILYTETIKNGKRERELLLLLAVNVALLISKDDMLTNVWKNSVVGENTVVVALSNIRKCLKGLMKSVSA